MSETTVVKGQFGLSQSGGTGKKLKIYFFTDMSWKKPEYGIKGRELCWLNSTIQSHDCFCGCNDPITHMIKLCIDKGGVFNFNIESAKKLLKCHSTETTPDAGFGETTTEKEDTGPEGDLNFGDLEKLFEEDTPFEDESSG